MMGLHPSRFLAVGLAVLGFGLTLAAEVQPWLDVTVTGTPRIGPDPVLDDLTSRRLSQLVTWQAPAYYVGITVLFALVAVALLGRPTIRRSVMAAAVGVVAGHAVLLAGLYLTVRDGDDFFGSIGRLRTDDAVKTGVGIGFYSAAAGLIVLTAAIGALARTGRPRPVPPEVTEESPADLTVTAVVT